MTKIEHCSYNRQAIYPYVTTTAKLDKFIIFSHICRLTQMCHKLRNTSQHLVGVPLDVDDINSPDERLLFSKTQFSSNKTIHVLQACASSGSTKWLYFFARSSSGNWINLPLNLYKLCAMYICLSVLSRHPKSNKLFDNSSTPHSLPNMSHPG